MNDTSDIIQHKNIKTKLHHILSHSMTTPEQYLEAIELCKELSALTEYKAILARLFLELAMLQGHNKNVRDSINCYKSASKEYDELLEKQQWQVTLEAAAAEYQLGLAYMEKKDLYLSRKHIRKAINIYDQYHENEEQVRPLIAKAYGSLAESYEEEDFENAIINWNISKKKFEELTEANPDFRPYLAATYNNIAVNQKRNFEHDKAAQNYMKALDIYHDLHKDNPEEFKPFLAGTYNSLGILFTEMYDKSEAYQFYQKALSLYSELVEEYPQMFQPYLATILHNMGAYFDDKYDYPKALEYYYQALEIRKELSEKNPSIFTPDYAVTGLNIITIYQGLLEKDHKIVYRDKAMDMLIDMVKAVNEIPKNAIIMDSIEAELKYYTEYFDNVVEEEIIVKKTIQSIAEMEEQWKETKDTTKRDAIENEMLYILEKTKELYPRYQEIDQKLCTTYGLSGWSCLLNKDFIKSEEMTRKSMELFPPTSTQHVNLGHALLFQDKKEEAFNQYKMAIEEFNNDRKNIIDNFDKDIAQFAIHQIDHPLLEEVKALFYKG